MAINKNPAVKRTFFTFYWLLSCLTFSSIEEVCAQSLPGQAGLKPFIHNLQPSDYHSHAQNFDVTQGPKGLIYVANKAGILQYDGYHWNKITLPHHNVVRQVELYDDTLFVGAKGSWGYIINDSAGTPEFISMKEKTEAAGAGVETVWRMISTKKGLYINSGERLMRWYKGKLHLFPDSLKIRSIFHRSDQNLFALCKNGALAVIDGKTIKPIYEGDDGLKNRSIVGAYPLKGDSLALITNTTPLILKDHTISPWLTEVQDLLKNSLVFNSIQLANGNIALATTSGLIIISLSGQLLHHIDKADGLPVNMTVNIFRDNRNNLWLPMNSGLAVLKAGLSVSYFGREKLGDRVNNMAFYKNQLFISTSQPPSKLTVSNNGSHFSKIFQTNEPCRNLLSTREGLLLGCESGLKIYKNNRVETISTNPEIFDLTRSDFNPNKIYAGSSQGIFPVYIDNGKWKAGNYIYKGNIRSVFVTEKNNLIAAGTEGVLCLKIRADSVTVNRYGKNDGLPPGPLNLGKMGNLFFAAPHDSSTWFRFEEKRLKIVENPFPELNLKEIFPRDSTSAWGWDGKIFVKLTKTKKGWQWQPIYSDLFHPYAIDGIFPAKNGDVWISGGEKLVRILESDINRKITPPEAPVFRTIRDLNGNPIHFKPNEQTTIDNNIKGFRINFSSLPFLSSDEITYQSRLVGFTNKWSSWRKEYFVDYSRIQPGSYTLQVRAKNRAGVISPVSSISLYIEPFWYQTWWAWVLFLFTLCSSIAGMAYWRFRRYRKRSQLLEKRVASRTRELSLSRDKISQQAKKLKELDQFKNQFYHNVSHEFRTPLTLILGSIQDILNTDKQELPVHVQEKLEPALRNGRRLRRLVNQLLELANIESEHVRVTVSLNDLTSLIRETLSSFESLAESNGISLTFSLPDTPCHIYYNPKQLETVLINLFSNAIKFTDAGGTVEIYLQETNNDVCIYVKDTGIGINETDLPHIFDRFYQVDSSIARQEEGIGIGLAYSYKLVELHHGSLSAKSKPGKGSTFTVRLLKGKAHFNNDQIIEKENRHSSEGKSFSAESVGLNTPKNEKKEASANSMNAEDRKTLLIIDDNADMCRYVRDIMEENYQVIEAHNGEEGFNLAKKNLPDIILCDVMMPSTDGFTFSRKLRRHAMVASIPVIFLTGRADKEGRLEGLESGADDYITKPFDAELLQARVKNMIEQRMRLRRLLQQEPPVSGNENVRSAFEKRVRVVILENLTDHQFGVKELAREVRISKSHLTHKLKEEAGMSASAYIRTLRLEQAAKMLKNHEGNVSEVAYGVGFNSLSYFSRSFKNHFDFSPSEYLT